MHFKLFTCEGHVYDPNTWKITRDAGTVSILSHEDLIVWQFTDRGEDDYEAICFAIDSIITETRW